MTLKWVLSSVPNQLKTLSLDIEGWLFASLSAGLALAWPLPAILTMNLGQSRMTLSEFIVSNLDRILEEWDRYARSVPSAISMNTPALRDHAEDLLRTIGLDMSMSQTADEQRAKSEGRGPHAESDTAAELHAIDRQSSGFTIDEVVSEYRALRASVIRLWTQQLEERERDALDEITRFNEGIDQALTESIMRYSGRVNQSRELFLSVLGHDLRSPLGAILNSSQYLMTSAELSGAHLKAAAAILRSGMRIRDIISDLLDVTRTRLGRSLPIAPMSVDLGPICEQVVEEARAYHPEHVVVFDSSGDLDGTWDPIRVAQLVGNLIENAIQHGAADRPVLFSVNADVDNVKLRVHNEGNPISESAQRTIFDPLTEFPTPRSDHRGSGLGLGLHIARAIADAHGGFLEVQSSAEEGTTFTAHLPRNPSSGLESSAMG